MDRRRWSMLPLALLALGGCHALLPFGARSSDGGPAIDRAGVELSRPEGCPPMALPGLAPGCQEDDYPSASCSAGECCGGGCDLLPDGRDPWGGRCNQIFVFQPFCSGDLGGTSAYCGVEASGLLAFRFGDSEKGFTGWVSYEVPVAAEDLVEARLRPSWTRGWSLQLLVRDGADKVVRGCVLSHAPASTELTLFDDLDGPWQTFPVPGSPASLIMQSYAAAGHHHCRLFAAGHLHSISTPLTPAAGARVQVAVVDDRTNSTAGLDLEVDYLRAFHP